MLANQSAELRMTTESFLEVKKRHQRRLDSHGLDARIGVYQGCPFMKLDKESWHNRGEVDTPTEIFFSIWRDLDGRLNYNIHAFKLRHFSDYNIQSREFAAAFRAKFTTDGWSNVSIKYGPLTLMQGWIDNQSEIDDLITNFISVHSIIDDLLAARKK